MGLGIRQGLHGDSGDVDGIDERLGALAARHAQDSADDREVLVGEVLHHPGGPQDRVGVRVPCGDVFLDGGDVDLSWRLGTVEGAQHGDVADAGGLGPVEEPLDQGGVPRPPDRRHEVDPVGAGERVVVGRWVVPVEDDVAAAARGRLHGDTAAGEAGGDQGAGAAGAAQDAGDAPRWYAAAGDPRLRAALQAMHEDAAHPWTVPELAALSGLSRAAFARAFTDVLGQPPVQYLTGWRMSLARDYLRDGTSSLSWIAANVGYSSPYAFTAAFRRHHGLPPGAWRRQQATEPLTTPARHTRTRDEAVG